MVRTKTAEVKMDEPVAVVTGLEVALQEKDEQLEATKPLPVVPEEQQIQWLKMTGTLYMGSRVIHAGEKFMAAPSQIPRAFRDTVRPLEALPAERPLDFVPANYRMLPSAELPGHFDIVDANGKKLNAKPLVEAAAKEIVTKMN